MSRTPVIVTDSGESNSLCRLCAKNRENCVNIFISRWALKLTVEEVIRDLITLKVAEGDGLPCTICLQCVGKLIEFRDFKDMCLISDIELRKSTVSYNCEDSMVPVKVEEDLPDQWLDNEERTSFVCIDASEFSSSANEGIPRDPSVLDSMDGMVLVIEEVVPDECSDDLEERVSVAASESSASANQSIQRDPLAFVRLMDSKDDIPRDPLAESDDFSEDDNGENEVTKDAIVLAEYTLEGQANWLNGDADACSEFKSSQLRNNCVQRIGHCRGGRHSNLSTQNLDEPDDTVQKLCKKPSAVEVSRKLAVSLEEGKRPVERQSVRRVEKDFARNRKRSSSEGRTRFCDVCSKTFSSSHYLRTHMLSHTGEKPFKCSICPSSFSRKNSLRIHNRVHSGEKPYSCTVCTKSFADQSALRKHSRIHTGEKRFTCTQCSKSFSHKCNLSAHIRSHTGERPYSCTVCTYSFAESSSLKKHMMIHTGEKPFTCSICSKSFFRKYRLRDHVCKQTVEKP